ncbi:MAG: sulfotransferase domain-containing protein [Oscillatoriales cyanobacterium RM1_1_9]|nr:sulfotransferase domain-containing protein [Oscillatoriales cyanobacterium RM1_1_9]
MLLRISTLFQEKIIDIDDYICQCSQVWTHSPVNSLASKILSKFDKVIYIIRDPRDVAISYSRFAFTEHKLNNSPSHYEPDPETYLENQLDQMSRYWVYHVGSYLKHQERLNIYPIFYEQLLHSFDSELIKLLKYLEIELNSSVMAQIKQEVSFTTMQRQSPNHLRQGTSRQWQICPVSPPP